MDRSKSALRKLAKQRLTQISEQDHLEKSKALSKNLMALIDQQKTIHKSIILGGFAPLDDEAQWFHYVDKSLNQAYPGANDEGNMEFYSSRLEDLIETEEFGVRVKTPKDKSVVATPNILLVPGLAFTENGDRLGRGKGFFDKYLERYSGIKLGICFEEQIFESVPTEDHDQKVDYVVTDGKVYRR